LCRLLTAQELPLEPGPINEICDTFHCRVARAGKALNVVRKLDICQNVFIDNQPLESAIRRAEIQMSTVSTHFCVMLEKSFIRHASEFLSPYWTNVFKAGLLKRSGAVYSRDVSHRADRHFHKLNLMLLDFYGRRLRLQEIPCAHIPMETVAPMPDREKDLPPAYRIIDPFGRGLLNPLNSVCRIAGINDPVPPGTSRFPREYCAPVLSVLQSLVFGPEKYQRVRSRFLRNMIEFCGTDRPDPELLVTFYRDEAMNKFIARFVLYVLMGLNSGARRMFFLRKVNLLLTAARGVVIAPFGGEHLHLLVRAWGTYARENRHVLPENLVDSLVGNLMKEDAPPSLQHAL
jgi:hypothetical protein